MDIVVDRHHGPPLGENEMFRTGRGDADLGPGDQLVLPPRTGHAATVSADGVRCIEASRQG
jgi:hypothetical protein